MEGLTEQTRTVFEAVSQLNCINDFILIGGTAITLQINHRLSEDLDFCKWKVSNQKIEVNWPKIEQELLTKFEVEKKDILGFDQVNFIINGVKISFYANNLYHNPVKQPMEFFNNIKIPDLVSLGAMKLEVMLRRSKFRDYYDIYSLLVEGVSLKMLIDASVRYSNYKLKKKHIISFISNSENFLKERNFDLLMPKYQVSAKGIEELIKDKMRIEFRS